MAVVHAASVKLIHVQVFVSVKLITWARLELYRPMEIQWCGIEVSGHLHAFVALLPALLPGKEESLVPTEQEVGWSGHYVVGSISFRPDIQRPRQMQNALRDI